jgi:hypothetical protein
MARCPGIKRDGGRCTVIVNGSQTTYCYQHDPKRAEERRRNASRAARSKPSREMAVLKGQLRAVADGVLSGAVEPKRGAVAVQALSALTRAIEQERKIKEADELTERLDALEDLVNQAESSMSHARW